MGKRGRRTNKSSHQHHVTSTATAAGEAYDVPQVATLLSECHTKGDLTVEEIIAQIGPDMGYLRLKHQQGQLPLSLFTHSDAQQLRIISLRDCNLQSLPPQITLLKNLRHLDIRGNDEIALPSQLSKCNLTRFVYTPATLLKQQQQQQSHHAPFDPAAGDRRVHVIPRLSQLAASVLLDACTLEELTELQLCVPSHLRDHLLPTVCAECGCKNKRIVATRTRVAVVAFHKVPLQYTLCSVMCLRRIQEVWRLEELLNEEKRALREQKFATRMSAAAAAAGTTVT